MTTPTEHHEVPGATLAYERAGTGRSGLVFVPGWCCPRSDFRPIAEVLADRPSVLIDLPGQGESTSARRQWTMTQFGEAVAELVRSLGWDDVALVGHSLGGAVCVEAAIALGPIARQVICVDSLVYDAYYSRQDEPFIRSVLQPIEANFDRSMYELVRGLFVDKESPLIDSIAATMASAPLVPALASQRALLEWDRDEAIARCPVPIDIIAARAFLDPSIPARLSPAARVTPVDLGGHFFLLERPVETAAVISSLLHVTH